MEFTIWVNFVRFLNKFERQLCAGPELNPNEWDGSPAWLSPVRGQG